MITDKKFVKCQLYCTVTTYESRYVLALIQPGISHESRILKMKKDLHTAVAASGDDDANGIKRNDFCDDVVEIRPLVKKDAFTLIFCFHCFTIITVM